MASKVGYMRDYVVTLDSDASTESANGGTTSATETSTENLQDREVIGKATTNRAANVREEPLANAKVVRQLGNGMELQILAKYAGVKEEHGTKLSQLPARHMVLCGIMSCM